jgi:hypothetical protein
LGTKFHHPQQRRKVASAPNLMATICQSSLILLRKSQWQPSSRYNTFSTLLNLHHLFKKVLFCFISIQDHGHEGVDNTLNDELDITYKDLMLIPAQWNAKCLGHKYVMHQV